MKYLAYLILLIPGLTFAQPTAKLIATLDFPKNGEVVQLAEILPRRLSKNERKLSSRVSNSKFSFLVDNAPGLYWLKIGGQSTLIFLGNDTTRINIQDSTLNQVDVVLGNAAKDFISYRKQTDTLSLIMEYGRARIDYDQYTHRDSQDKIVQELKLKTRDSLLNKLHNKFASIADSWIKNQPLSDINAKVLFDEITSMGDDSVKLLFNSLPSEVKNNVWSRELKYYLDSLTIGGILPPFEFADAGDNAINLRAVKGEYVLVDIWASWCIPCRSENPNLVALYKKFKTKGLNIVSVASDDDKGAWLKAIKNDELTWINLLVPTGSDKDFTNKYYIRSIPSNFLMDSKGVIVGKNLYGNDLLKKLEELLK